MEITLKVNENQLAAILGGLKIWNTPNAVSALFAIKESAPIASKLVDEAISKMSVVEDILNDV